MGSMMGAMQTQDAMFIGDSLPLRRHYTRVFEPPQRLQNKRSRAIEIFSDQWIDRDPDERRASLGCHPPSGADARPLHAQHAVTRNLAPGGI